MIHGRPALPERPTIEGRLPAIAGWQTFPRAFASLLALALAVCGGEWIVHQSAYAIEYGSRFSQVMADTPHRYYMASVGGLLGVSALALLTAVVLGLALLAHARAQFQGALPAWLARYIPAVSLRVPFGSCVLGAGIMAAAQLALYTVQENLEAGAMGAPVPGLAVLVGPGHGLVIPLALFVSVCFMFLISCAASLRVRLRGSLRVAESLARLASRWSKPRAALSPHPDRIPNLRLVWAALSPRSPPRAA